jgi:hypothetical protein
MFAPLLASIFLLNFQPRSWLERMEFNSACIRYVPKPVFRWIGEPNVEIPVTSLAKEIVICQGSMDNIPYGFRVFVRGANIQNREIKVETAERLKLRDSTILTEGIATATGLSVRLVQRQHLSGGVTQETPWVPSGQISWLRPFAILIFFSLPFVGGAVVGFLSASPLVIVTVGITLWLSQTLGVVIYARNSHKQLKFAFLYWLTTLFTFAATYAFTVVIVSFLFRSH